MEKSINIWFDCDCGELLPSVDQEHSGRSFTLESLEFMFLMFLCFLEKCLLLGVFFG